LLNQSKIILPLVLSDQVVMIKPFELIDNGTLVHYDDKIVAS